MMFTKSAIVAVATLIGAANATSFVRIKPILQMVAIKPD